MTRREKARAYYLRTKAARVCKDCRSKLPEDDKHVKCEACRGIDRKRYQARKAAGVYDRQCYTPLDQIMDSQRVRLLRVVARFDWVPSNELLDLAGIQRADLSEADNARQRLLYMVHEGWLERERWIQRHVSIDNQFHYRITAKGRAGLARLLNPPLPVATDDEADLHLVPDAWKAA